MKNYGKTFIIILILICAANSAFSQNSIEFMQVKADVFAESLAKSLPLNSTMGLNWSDAYIGKITDTPSHFGAGISAGFTTTDFTAVKEMLECFNIFIPVYERFESIGLPVPGYTVEGRIGGFKLPFDFGIKAGFLPKGSLGILGSMAEDFDFDFKQMLLGADIRYSILKYNKTLPVRLSVGLGFNFLDGGINAELPEGSSFVFANPGKGINFIHFPAKAQADLVWRTMNAEFKTHVSFPFKFVTPYAGAGVSYAISKAGYKVTGTELKTDTGEIKDIEKLMLDEYKLTGISDKGFETIKTFNGISVRVFGGASINLAYFRIDLTGMYEFLSGNFGATIGLRFQL